MSDPNSDDLSLFAVDAYGLFESDPEQWPDVVQFNRAGLAEVAIRAIWNNPERIEFVTFPLEHSYLPSSDENASSPDSSGAAG